MLFLILVIFPAFSLCARVISFQGHELKEDVSIHGPYFVTFDENSQIVDNSYADKASIHWSTLKKLQDNLLQLKNQKHILTKIISDIDKRVLVTANEERSRIMLLNKIRKEAELASLDQAIKSEEENLAYQQRISTKIPSRDHIISHSVWSSHLEFLESYLPTNITTEQASELNSIINGPTNLIGMSSYYNRQIKGVLENGKSFNRTITKLAHDIDVILSKKDMTSGRILMEPDVHYILIVFFKHTQNYLRIQSFLKGNDFAEMLKKVFETYDKWLESFSITDKTKKTIMNDLKTKVSLKNNEILQRAHLANTFLMTVVSILVKLN